MEGIYRRLAPLYQKTIDMGGFMCIDMEQLKYREITDRAASIDACVPPRNSAIIRIFALSSRPI